MKFALVDSKRAKASSGARGNCGFCDSELIAKCGPIRMHHWAHKKGSSCDPWWENETEWHRLWKNNYPEEWQEFIMHDEETGEKHIADVLTSHDLVIEFQHSFIKPQERTSREEFYKNMIWVVDGTRLKRDYLRFLKGKDDLRKTNIKGYFIINFPDECFPSSWLESSVPVIFDFLVMESIDDNNDLRNNLYYLFPRENKRKDILAVISREFFINNTINGELFKKLEEPLKLSAKPPIQNKNIKRRRESHYYYDPQKGRVIRKRRL